MRIAEIPSQEFRQSPQQHSSPSHHQLLSLIESAIKQVENLNLSPNESFPNTISGELRQSLTQLSQLAPFSNSLKLLLWKLSYRLWNACVDFSNAASIRCRSRSPVPIEELAKLRHIAADFLFLAGEVAGVPSPAIKSASFYHKTGLIWYDLRNFDLASTCFEKATDIVSNIDINSITDSGERKLLLDLSIARGRTAWQISDYKLAVALLNRAKSLLFGLTEHHKMLGNQYMMFGKSLLSNKSEDGALNDPFRLMNEALDIYEKGLRAAKIREEMTELKELKLKTLRFISAVHLQMGEFESVIKCVKVLREDSGDNQHPSLPVLAMKAWLGLKRYGEAEKELRGMVVNKGVPEGVWVSAVEAYFQAAGTAGAETTKGVFLGLLGRCSVSASAAVRVAHKVIGDGDEGSRVRAKVVGELVSDERVVALFTGDAATKQRMTMHALLWNCAANYFRSKDYETSAEMFEKSMLFIPYGIEDRILRAKGYRVLCLCHLGLSQLDQAQEYINEAEKLEPNVASAFLKFKIFLQKNDQTGATNQIQAMTTCLDFNPDYLSLSAHEAVACNVLPVAVSALSNLLNFYALGKSNTTSEVVALRTLVTILTQESGNELEALKFVKRAYNRASELGHDCFFGKGDIGKRELKWFAVTSWNFGTKAGKEGIFQLCANFLRLASEFYDLLIESQEEENSNMVCKSLILAVSAMIASENQMKAVLPNTEVRQALEMLDRAGKILKSISTGTRLKNNEVNTLELDFYYIFTFCAYEIQGRLNDLESQLLIVKNFASLKACNPNYLLQIGLNASQGPRSNLEVANFALNESLSALLSSPLPNFQNVALIVRKLIAVASIHNGNTDNDAVYDMYKRAYRIMVGLKDGEYPIEEAKWLATTAWNRAAVPLRLGQIDVANKWMTVGLELAKHVPGMEVYSASMEDFVSSFAKEFSVQVNGENRPQLIA